MTVLLTVCFAVFGGVTGQLPPASAAQNSPAALTVNSLTTPADVAPGSTPLLGWQVGGDRQTAYQIQVAATSSALTGTPDVWDSGQVASAADSNVSYGGPALTASSGYYWRVRTWDSSGAASPWSAAAAFGTGPGSTWPGATPIWSGAPTAWTNYTFQGSFVINAKYAGVTFRAQDTSNYYLWQFKGNGENTIAPQIQKNGAFTALKTAAALPFALTTGSTYDFRIDASGSTFTTSLKAHADTTWTQVDTTTDTTFTAGGIGFRTGLTEQATFDDLTVTGSGGQSLYANDFGDADNADFTCGTVTNGALFVDKAKNCGTGFPTAWTNYTFQGSFVINAKYASVTFRAQDTSNYYLWQFKGNGENTIAPQIQKNGAFTALKTAAALPFALTTGSTYDFRIDASGSTFTTSLKAHADTTWTQVDTTTDTTFTAGGIGFRTGSTEQAAFDDLTVTGDNNRSLYSNDFSDAANADFTCGTVTNGALSLGTGKNCGTGLLTVPSWSFLRGSTKLAVGKSIAWAHLYATGASTTPARQFVYKLWVNGSFVGVGPTRPVGSEARYDGYDVTSLLTAGAVNTVGALAYTTSDQRFLAQLVVRYTDGTTKTLNTGAGWKSLDGTRILPNAGSIGTSYYSAPKENFDARRYPFGFATSAFDASAWPAAVTKAAFGNLQPAPTAKVRQSFRTPVSVTEYSAGNYFVDYGRTWVGGLSLNLTGTAGQVVDIRYGEVTSGTNTVKYQTSAGNAYQDKWVLKSGSQQLETWGLRVFRYAQVIGAPTGLTSSDFKAEAYLYPFDESAGAFASSDTSLNAVWALSRNTVEATNLNLYVDSWERERDIYEADTYLQLMGNLYTGGDTALGDYSLNFLRSNRTWPTEWPMYVILAMHDSYETTGNTAPLSAAYTALQGKLPDEWYESATGLIHKTTGSTGAGSCTDCDIVDWPTSERDGYVFTSYNTVVNALAHRAYENMADIATALGKSADAAAYTAKADAIKAAVNARMWDSAKGAYRDGLNNDGTAINHYAVQASAFAGAFGLADSSQAAQVASYLGSRGMACSVYCAPFVIQALYEGNRPDLAHTLLTSTGTRSWMNMINDGAGATMEAWDLSLKSNTTYSHPWAASPAFTIARSMFGVQPTAPGYRTFRIKPQPTSVTWANVTVPTAHGTVGAAYDTTGGGRVDVGVKVPANTSASVYLPGGTAGTTSVFMDGSSVAATYDNGFLRVDGVQPGCHVVTTASDSTPYSDVRLTGIC
ncbi:family 78 glycoside hydrolase catalytic domain [Streptomyces sp. AK04-3B]|uniref:family 78 glycoside hydrolase catalytic domain n=1 Tax=Streptomyces sp. AK04-3B TaxID=3028650 RepID=UPI0029A6D9EB|nr:family 78 glycoside hydrolase catalytic domain [Streptomyces sp. AK04-3B]MDX3800164.1 family 78 glycoside hydrolase catalytic domain [Streptomyces sp. AK04-3B]